MTEPLNILAIEDSQTDFLLIERQLKQQGLVARCRQVQSIGQLTENLDRGRWDVVLMDYAVPHLDFLDCLGLVLTRLPDVPVIVVSGTIGEERAVALLKQGVSDFVLKESLIRLGQVIERSLREATDRRERRAADAELQLLKAALCAAADAVVITDRHGTIEWINPAFTTIAGYSAEEAVGRNPRDLVKSGVHGRSFYQGIWNTILAGQVWRGEITNRHRDGRLYPEDLAITPVVDASGEIMHFVAMKRDLTVEKQRQAQLLQAQKMETVGQLAAGIAHDFNNLTTVITGTAEMEMLRLPACDPAWTGFESILKAGARASAVTRQLLAFSRHQILRPELLDLSAVVTDMKEMLSRLLGEDITMTVISPQAMGCVRADRGQMEQTIMNLAVNARDAMPAGGTLTIEIAEVELDEAEAATHVSLHPGPHVMLAVSDTGVGIDKETLSRIFEPFFTTKDPGKGTGLGLSVVCGVVQESKGSILVASEPGKGSTFKVYLPRVHGVQAAPQPPPAQTTVGGTETILIVEDDKTLRRLASRILQMAGYTMLTAGGGQEALQLLEQHDGPVDLVVTDVVMPGMTGPQFAERLTKSHAALKVLYTSGYTDDVIVRHGLLGPGTNFLGKPYSMKSLTGKVRELLDG